MRRRLVVSYLAFALVVLAALEVPLGVLAAGHELDAVRSSARQDATVLAAVAYRGVNAEDRDGGGTADGGGQQELDELTRRYATETGAEVTVVDAAGKRVAYQPAAAEKGHPDPSADALTALKGALAGRTTVRSVTDEGRPVVVAAVPVKDAQGKVDGAVEVALPAAEAQHRIRVLMLALAGFAVVALGAVVAVGVLLARSVVRPLADLEGAVGALEAGELAARTEPGGPPELRSLGVSFNRMADQLGELINSQRRFIADASHQLRSPLTALRLRLEAVDTADPDATRRHVAAAIEETGRLSRLVDGLLELARTEGRRPARSVLALDPIVQERAEMWGALADEREVRLELDLPPGATAVQAVPGHVDQILDNLLANALEVAPRGSAIVVRAINETVDGAPRVLLSVIDSGPGMTEEQRDAAFTRFWQSDTQPTGSSGLGLAISHQLALASDGDLELHAEPTGGLEARLLLDPAPAPAADRRAS